jgi:hypothetical protein
LGYLDVESLILSQVVNVGLYSIVIWITLRTTSENSPGQFLVQKQEPMIQLGAAKVALSTLLGPKHPSV